jgi:hypothetical protein
LNQNWRWCAGYKWVLVKEGEEGPAANSGAAAGTAGADAVAGAAAAFTSAGGFLGEDRAKDQVRGFYRTSSLLHALAGCQEPSQSKARVAARLAWWGGDRQKRRASRAPQHACP